MAVAHLVVVGVVGGGDLDDTGALGHIGVLIADNGDLLVQDGQDDVAAMQMGIAGILGVDGNSGITQHGLGTGGSQFQHFAGLLDGVKQVPEIAGLLLVFDLGIGDGGDAVGAPVNHPVSTVDIALLVQADKNFLNGIRAALVHGETLPLPVAGGTQLLQLLNNTVAIGILPLPGPLQEAFTAQHILGQAFFCHSFNNLGLSGDGSVVSAGQPQGGVALHPLGTDQNILHGVVHCVAHVELAGDIGGRHNDGVGLLVFVPLCVEVAVVLPHSVDGRFDLRRVVDLRQFSCHF